MNKSRKFYLYENRIKRILFCSIILSIAFCAVHISPAKADLIYLPKEYNALYNEKVALELELKSLKNQFTNERANLESRIKDLEKTIDELKGSLALSEKSREEDNKANQQRIKEMESVRNILQKKGSDREKELIEENKNLQKQSKEESERLRNELQKERESKIAELAKQKAEYEKKISELNARLNNVTDELSEIKKLSDSQKKELERMSAQAGELEKQLEDEIKKGEIRLKRQHEKLIINIDDKISFDSGQAELKKGVLNALDKIATILSDYPENTIMIEGHTDNVPISTKKFRDNWQLSSERALAVLGYLLKNTRLDAGRFAAAGYGEYKPIVSNDTSENKALNRRVDIVVIPRLSKK
jgi:chemotaxis protein MotB